MTHATLGTEETNGYFRQKCTCGWFTPWRTTEYETAVDVKSHQSYNRDWKDLIGDEVLQNIAQQELDELDDESDVVLGLAAAESSAFGRVALCQCSFSGTTYCPVHGRNQSMSLKKFAREYLSRDVSELSEELIDASNGVIRTMAAGRIPVTPAASTGPKSVKP